MRVLQLGVPHSDDNRLLGLTLRESRLAQRMAQTDLAEAAGVSRSMLCSIEHGRSAPSVTSLTAVLSALGEEHTVTDNESVIWGELTLVCTRFSRYRLIGQHLPVGGVTASQQPADHGYVQILDWK